MGSSTHCHVLVDLKTNHHDAVPGEILAFATCRDERLRLPAFLAHYRGLGVDRFFIVDNGSSDGTTEYLAEQPDVHLFLTANRFSEAGSGVAWQNALLAEFGVGRWSLTVDIDELLVYPRSEHASLRVLTRYLDDRGYEALACVLLDLYPSGPLKDCRFTAGDDLFAAAPCFDTGPYGRSPSDLCPGVLIRGGMRERVFYPEFRSRTAGAKIYDGMLEALDHRVAALREMPWLRARRRRLPPCLTKVPLVRWDAKSARINNHWVSPKIVAPISGALLHFKFLQDFHDRAIQEVARSEHYDGAYEYQRYAQRLKGKPDFTLSYEGSTRFEGTAQLVQLGLVHDTDEWTEASARPR